MIKLGDSAQDKLTKFTGIAIGRSEYLYSNVRIYIQPEAMDGTKPIDAEWFDEGRLELVSANNCVGFRMP
jgi:hypothetical protein